MSSRDSHRGQRQDKTRARLNALQARDREQEAKFEAMPMMQRPGSGGGDQYSRVQAQLADYNARLAIIEAELAQSTTPPPPARRIDYPARWLALLAFMLALIAFIGAISALALTGALAGKGHIF